MARIQKKIQLLTNDTCTFLILCTCILVFLVTIVESTCRSRAQKSIGSGILPIERALLFDYPTCYRMYESIQNEWMEEGSSPRRLSAQQRIALERCPIWPGFLSLWKEKEGYDDDFPRGELFHDVRKGELWRLITPVFLHLGFLHLLFNMAWLWVLGVQIEQRIGRGRYLIVSLIVSVVANISQYLMSGPFFAGYSGVIIGLVGFIWMRQKIAPWEQYPLPKPMAAFIAISVVLMILIEIGRAAFAFVWSFPSIQIAHTAHVMGGIAGLSLGRLGCFSIKERP